MKNKKNLLIILSTAGAIALGTSVCKIKPFLDYEDNISLENRLDSSTYKKVEDNKLPFNYSQEELNKFDNWIDSTLNESSKDSSYSIIVNKVDKTLYLIKDGKLDSKYYIDLGFNPYDDKQVEGDCCTPEGRYLVEKKIPAENSSFYKALLINYPNSQDKAKGKTGSFIEIHGEGGRGYNWTLGCMAPSNEDMDKIFKNIKEGNRVTIVRYTSRDLLLAK